MVENSDLGSARAPLRGLAVAEVGEVVGPDANAEFQADLEGMPNSLKNTSPSMHSIIDDDVEMNVTVLPFLVEGRDPSGNELRGSDACPGGRTSDQADEGQAA